MTRNAASGEVRDSPRAGLCGDRSDQVVSVLRCVLGTARNTAELEDELHRRVRSQHRSKGMECQVVLRSLDRAGIYLHLSCWRSPSDLFGALHTDTAGVGFHELGRLAALEPGQAVPVGLMGAGLSLGEAAHVLLVRVTLSGSAPAFELQFGALAGQFLYTPGFGGGLLLRSTLDPRGYLGLIWWSSARSCDDALRGARSQERRRQLLDLTDELAFERAQVVADDA